MLELFSDPYACDLLNPKNATAGIVKESRAKSREHFNIQAASRYCIPMPTDTIPRPLGKWHTRGISPGQGILSSGSSNATWGLLCL
jgi:hypothetical protein